MRGRPIGLLTRLAPLLAIWLALMVLLASPAWGDHDDDDDDDDDDGRPPVSTTTSIPPPTTTTHRPAPTTTTSTTTTTTAVIPRDESWVEQRLESWVATPTTTTATPEAPGENESKDAFVLSMGARDGGNGGDGPGDSGGRGAHISPREGLTVAFRTAVEVIESQLHKALLLGVLVAGFLMVGVDKRQVAPAAQAKC